MKKKLGITLILAAVIAVPIIVVTAVAGDNESDNPGQVSGQSSSELSASWAYAYLSIQDLHAAADLVAVGTIDKVLSEQPEGLGKETKGFVLYGTDFAFDVEEVLKGKTEAQQISIHQTGASAKQQQINDDPLMAPGEQYVLFLQKYEAGKYFILGGPQGRFKISDDSVYSMNRVNENIMVPAGLDINGSPKDEFALQWQ